MYDHMKEALKRHIGKSKVMNDKDEDDIGSQKGPGNADHAPSLGGKGVEELAAPNALMPGAPHVPPQGGLGPEHLAVLQQLMSHGGSGLDAKAAASSREKYASIEKHKEGKK